MAAESSAIATPLQPAVHVRTKVLLGLTLFSAGHFFIDLYSSALGVFQPLLIDKLGFSLSQAGILGGLLSLTSSVSQPAFGILSDRYRTRMFSALAPAIAGVSISSLGLANSYVLVAWMVGVGGAAIASFHPQASSRATLGLENRARWLAVFISAGTLGLGLGPAVFSTLFRILGLEKAAWAALPGIIMTVLLVAMIPDRAEGLAPVRFDLRPLARVWKPMAILYLLVFLRSVVQISFTQFLPLYLSRERGYSLTGASWALSLYLVSGAVGGMLGGHLAQRFGEKPVIRISMAGCLPFLFMFFLMRGPASMVGLALGGLIMLFTIPVNVVMAQQLLPSQEATASALMMGFGWGMAGLIFIPITGWAADHFTLHAALFALILLPAAGFVLSYFLHDESRLSS